MGVNNVGVRCACGGHAQHGVDDMVNERVALSPHFMSLNLL
jgi:hypothetical protein